jgi:hypothetical protein
MVIDIANSAGNVICCLLESPCYLDLPLTERYRLVKRHVESYRRGTLLTAGHYAISARQGSL